MDHKMRILAVERMLSNKPITAAKIMEKLENEYAITCERKVIYDDIAALTVFMPNLYKLKSKKGYVLVDDFDKWEEFIEV